MRNSLEREIPNHNRHRPHPWHLAGPLEAFGEQNLRWWEWAGGSKDVLFNAYNLWSYDVANIYIFILLCFLNAILEDDLSEPWRRTGFRMAQWNPTRPGTPRITGWKNTKALPETYPHDVPNFEGLTHFELLVPTWIFRTFSIRSSSQNPHGALTGLPYLPRHCHCTGAAARDLRGGPSGGGLVDISNWLMGVYKHL